MTTDVKAAPRPKARKAPNPKRRRRLLILLAIALPVAVFLGVKWKSVADRGGQQPVEPFRIAGNLYYVGANDVTAYLLTGPQGHVLIDGGYPGTAPLIMASIAKLGFRVTDVKVLVNTESHFDHAGGLAALQKASGAQLWVSEGAASAIAAGGAEPLFRPIRLDRGEDALAVAYRILSFVGLLKYPAPRIDHRFRDGTTLHVGPVELTAHVTAGHAPGCTSWSFPVRDGARVLQAVAICDLVLLPGVSLAGKETYPGIRADYEHTFRTLRGLPADIFLAPHASEFGMWGKKRESATATDPVQPFIDRKGYLDYINRGEERFRRMLAEQQRNP